MELNNTKSLFDNLRDSYKVQYGTQRNLLDQQRRDAQVQLMGEANKAGMLYSNFPQRTQIQYDTNTYMPSLTSLYNTYQTGLDDLRTKGTQLANNITSLEEAISDLNNDIYAVL